MKIILTQEVSDLGSPGDVVEVKDGYGRNYLLPQGYAIRWSKGGEKQVATIKRAREVREIQNLDQAQEVKGQLEALKVKITARAGDAGRLFGSITSAEITDAIKDAGGPDVDRRRLELPGPIKTVGDYQVKVRLHPEVSATIPVEVAAAK
ncbi:MAG: 50S ribosomal protein L9 [Micromonosporaceae bacterium]